MSTFRTKAVATAVAVALTFGGVSTAAAETTSTPSDPKTVDNAKDFEAVMKAGSSEGDANLSSKVAPVAQADQEAFGYNLLGQYTDDSKNPVWARIWREVTYAGIGVAAVSTLIAIYNFAVFHGLVPDVMAMLFRK